jgi:hypothetical protein
MVNHIHKLGNGLESPKTHVGIKKMIEYFFYQTYAM